VTNFSTSFQDGLAFCALIDAYHPELINFDSLPRDPEGKKQKMKEE